MDNQLLLGRKCSNRLAFEHYLRVGEKLTLAEFSARFEAKFNPYHDERGRFTFATGSAGVGASSSLGTKPQSRQVARGRTTVSTSRAVSSATRIPTIPGYPEDKRTTWRSSNDAAFIAAANFYNKKYKLKPGDQGYRTPQFLKAWAMRESGGEGDERIYRTDPFQVNNPGDWPQDNAKQRIAGLRKNERMTPAKSAYAALEWLRYKAQRFDERGKVIGYRNDLEALQRYNGNRARTRQSGSSPHYVWYAATIMRMAADAK